MSRCVAKVEFHIVRPFAFAALPIPCENDSRDTRLFNLFHSPGALAHQKCISASSRALRSHSHAAVDLFSRFSLFRLFPFWFRTILLFFFYRWFADTHSLRMCEWMMSAIKLVVFSTQIYHRNVVAMSAKGRTINCLSFVNRKSYQLSLLLFWTPIKSIKWNEFLPMQGTAVLWSETFVHKTRHRWLLQSRERVKSWLYMRIYVPSLTFDCLTLRIWKPIWMDLMCF